MPDLIAEKIEKQLGTAQILRGVSFSSRSAEILALPRRLGKRQDHAAALGGRIRATRRREDRDTRQTGFRCGVGIRSSSGATRSRVGISILRDLAAPLGF